METLEIIICFVSAIATLIVVAIFGFLIRNAFRQEKEDLKDKLEAENRKIKLLLCDLFNLTNVNVKLHLGRQTSVEIDNDGIAWVQLSIQATSKEIENIIEIIKEKRHM